MHTLRRLTSLLATTALSWTALTLVVATPSAHADAPHDPATYYAGTEGLSGAALATALNAIIDGNTQLTYAQVYDALPVTDEDPNNTANLIDFYSGTSLAKSARCGSGSCAGQWNREHTWPQSHGDLTTGVGPGTDLFHMRPEFADTNSSRGNKDFDNGGTANVPSCAVCRSTTNTFEPRAAIRGDLARGLMYMDVRFNGDATDGTYGQDLVLGENVPTSGPHIGRLSTLVAWSLADPPDAAERARNNLIDGTYQHNRNPFIDHPEWVCSIWGSSVPAGTCNVAVNQPPTTAPMAKTTAEDTATTVALTASDPDGDPLSWSVTSPGTHGSASITGGSTLSYTPAADYHGSDVVGVTVSDGKGGTAATTVTITVTPVNDPPTATPQSVSTPEDAATVVTVGGSDVDGDTLGFAIGAQPAHGSVSLAGDQATYTPAADYHGPDSFTFTASDGTVTSPAAAVSITVTSAGNHAPVATSQDVSTPEDTVKVVTLAGTDVDGDTLGFAIAGQPAHGSVSLAGDEATYTPAADYTGPDSFTFTADDGTLTSSAATVSVAVSGVNDLPAATPQGVSTAEDTAKDVTLAGTDPDGDALDFAIAGQPAHGSVSLAGDEATYTPAANYHGPDSFTFTVNDGTVTSPTATVSVTVSSVNDAPAATTQSVTTPEDAAKVVTLAGTDVDSDGLTYAIGTGPAHGTVNLIGDQATYTPAANYDGPDSFTFTVDDGTVTSPPAAVSIAVSPVNDAPTLSDVTLSTTAGNLVSTTLAPVDIDGDTLTIDSVTTPAHGTVEHSGLTVTYTPTARSATDTLSVTVSDGHGGSATAVITVSTAARTATLSLSTQPATRGKPATTIITASGPAGVAPSGPVTLRSGGVTVGTARLGADGTAKVTWVPTLAGVVGLDAAYDGDGLFAPATAVGVAAVDRSASELTLTGKLKKNGRGKLVVSIASIGGVAATGKVTVKVGSARLTATLRDGVATFRIRELPSRPRLGVVATYAGDGQYAAGTARRPFRLR